VDHAELLFPKTMGRRWRRLALPARIRPFPKLKSPPGDSS